MPNIRRLLMQLEADIEASEANLARQRELVAELTDRGQPSLFAGEILLELEAIRAKQMRLRDRLKSELASRPTVLVQDVRTAERCPSSERM